MSQPFDRLLITGAADNLGGRFVDLPHPDDERQERPISPSRPS